MNDVLRAGARSDQWVLPRFPVACGLRTVVACAFLAVLGWSSAVSASVLYQCVGPGGEAAFVSDTTGYHECRKVGAWPDPKPRLITASARKPPASDLPHAQVLPGAPPKQVKANPAILHVMPLGGGDTITVETLDRSHLWQPLPVVVMHALADRVLPQLLGVTPTASPEPPHPAATDRPQGAAAAPIPLRVSSDPSDGPRRGAVYRVRQKDGSVLYTNVASLATGQDAHKLFTYLIDCYACDIHSKIDWNTVPLELGTYRSDIARASSRTGVDAALLRAVIHAESGFDPRALSYKGAEGLMQLMPRTAAQLGVGDAFNPGQNISGGARYLAGLLREYHGDVKLAAAAYNAGSGMVARYGGVPPFAETQVYVKRVALLYQRYRKALAGEGAVLAARQ